MFKICYFNSNKPKSIALLLDFDYTVSNFGSMKLNIKRELALLGLDEVDFDHTYIKSKNLYHVYDPEIHIVLILNILNISRDKITNVFDSVFHEGFKYVYDDVEPFLLLNQDIDIYLFTLGDKKFQDEKFNSSRISKYFKGKINSIVSKTESISEVIEEMRKNDYKKIFMVDDKLANFDFDLPVQKICINRINSKYYNENVGIKIEDVQIYDKLTLIPKLSTMGGD